MKTKPSLTSSGCVPAAITPGMAAAGLRQERRGELQCHGHARAENRSGRRIVLARHMEASIKRVDTHEWQRAYQMDGGTRNRVEPWR